MPPKYMTLDSVVREYFNRPQKSVADYNKEIMDAMKYYGNLNIITERETEIVVTEDAEVISIETAHKHNL